MTTQADLDLARKVIEQIHHCVLAVSSLDGRPWVAPVFFNYDADWHFYWESAKDARHSQLITENPRVAIVVADFENIRGVYVEALAREVPAEQIESALASYLQGPHEKTEDNGRTIGDYAPGRRLRLYVADPEQFFLMKRVSSDDGTLDLRIALPEM